MIFPCRLYRSNSAVRREGLQQVVRGNKYTVTDRLELKKGEKPTLKTIARLSGLAVPTVSRALNDAPDIKSATKVRVREIAEGIGYVPNRAGVRLRTGRTNVISLVLSTQHDLTNHTGSLISSIAGALQGTPFHMNVTPYFPNEDIMKPIRYIVETRSADAVILNQVAPNDERVRYLMDKNFPFVTHGRSLWCDQHPYYDFDNEIVGDRAMRKLADRGRRNILLIAPPRDQFYAKHTIDGCERAAKDLGIAITTHPTITSDFPRIPLTDEIADFLQKYPEIDGIICASTSSAMASVASLERIGRNLGEDIDVFAKEAVSILEWFRPGILTVFEDVTIAGDFVARAAMQAVKNPDAPPMQCLEKPVF